MTSPWCSNRWTDWCIRAWSSGYIKHQFIIIKQYIYQKVNVVNAPFKKIVRALAPTYLVSLLSPIWGAWMRLYAGNLFKMLLRLPQFKFRRFGKNVIQFALAYLETQLQYTVQFIRLWIYGSHIFELRLKTWMKAIFASHFQGCNKFKCHLLVIVYLGFVSLSAWVFLYCSNCFIYIYISFSFNRTLRLSIALLQGRPHCFSSQ